VDKRELEGLRDQLDEFLVEFEDCFRTRVTRKHLGTYVEGQLGPLQRKSVEPMALDAGVPPRTLQEFLSIHRWDEDLMRSRVREIVAEDHAHPNAIGVVDETSFAKKGDKTVAVQRQYCGSTGKVDNCVVTVHLSYVAPEFSTLVDYDIYLPKSWAGDWSRRKAAGVPDGVCLRPKWKIALDLIDRTRVDDVPLRWITADEAYGQVPAFLSGVEERGLFYMVEVPRSVAGWSPSGLASGRDHRRVEDLWKRGGPSWETYVVKETTKGPVVWHARVTQFFPSWAAEGSDALWLVVAEEALTGELKYFLSNAPLDTTVGDLLTVAFTRWRVERNFQDSKQQVGLGHFEVRKYVAVQRHLALSMVSLLFLTRAAQALRGGGKGGQLDIAADPCRRRSSA